MSVTTPDELSGPATRPPLLSDLGELGDSGLLLGLMLVVLLAGSGVAALLTWLA